MKLISLNVWGGTIYRPLVDFIERQSVSTDIFCFQEVFSALPGAPKVSSGARMFLFEELAKILTEFSGFFEMRSAGFDLNGSIDAPVSHGLATFVRRTIEVRSENGKLIDTVGESSDHWVKAQVLGLELNKIFFNVINFHGITLPGDKMDTPERLNQSRKLLQIWNGLEGGAKILCGDFNLELDTESIRMLEAYSRNLIRDFKILNTRNQVSWDRFPSSHQKYADYMFVSPNIKINQFLVPYNEVSDHLPLVLEFDL